MPVDIRVGQSSGRTRSREIDLLKIDAEKSELDIINGIEDDDWPKIDQNRDRNPRPHRARRSSGLKIC